MMDVLYHELQRALLDLLFFMMQFFTGPNNL